MVGVHVPPQSHWHVHFRDLPVKSANPITVNLPKRWPVRLSVMALFYHHTLHEHKWNEWIPQVMERAGRRGTASGRDHIEGHFGVAVFRDVALRDQFIKDGISLRLQE